MTLSKEVKVGLLAVVSGVILYLGFNFLKGSDFLSSNTKYFAVYDHIDGLTESNPVMLNGLKVGMVRKIVILKNRDNKLLVQIDIKSDIALTDSSEAMLSDNGLLGGKIIVLLVGKGTQTLGKNDTLRASVEKGMAAVLKQRAQPVIDNLDTLANSLKMVVAQFDSTGYMLQQTLKNFRETSSTLNNLLADNRGNLSGTLANFNKLSVSLMETEKGLKPLLGKMNNVADTLSQLKLNQAVESANRAIGGLNTILADINAGKGTIGKVAKSDSLYTNLNKTSADLDRLLVDFRKNPKRYVHFSLFGRKEKKPQGSDTLRVKRQKIVTTYK